MSKRKRLLKIGYRERLSGATRFDHSIFAQPRDFTRHMSSIVCYPELINDLGRTVDVRRDGDNRFSFEIRQKRYLGRGTYSVSARAKGFIHYDEDSQQTRVSGYAQVGGHYLSLLIFMTMVALLSMALCFITILFLPLSLLMIAVLVLHWTFLFADRDELQVQLTHLVYLTERAERLKNSESNPQSIESEETHLESIGLERQN